VVFYEPWNEEVTVTKTRTVTDANGHEHEEKYKTTEIKYHSEEYTYCTNTVALERNINKQTYDKIKARLKTKAIFKDLHRDYHTNDGDAYESYYDNSYEHIYTVTEEESYLNRVRANPYTIFGYTKISKEKADSLGLYEYPEIKSIDQCPVIGKKLPYWQEHAIRYINGRYGKEKQFRLYILLYENKKPEIAEYQKSYWYQGNKNELVICLGLKGDSITWCRGFSWCDEPILEIKSRDYFITHPKLNLYRYSKFIEANLKHWHRKEFKDFDYISVEFSGVQTLVLILLMLISTIGTYVIVWKQNRK
jgi:hypothetical protein